MIPYVRFYEEAAARSVVERLKAGGFDTVLMVEPSGGVDAVQKAIDDEFLDMSLRALATKQLAEGHFMVSVRASFGFGKRAGDILEADNPILVVTSVRVSPRNPSPLSDSLGIGTLSPGKSSYTALLDNSATLTGFIPLLSRPKSGRKSAMGIPLLSKPRKDWKRSFGIFPLLSKNPAPLSSLLGLSTLTDETKRKEKN